ncbi:MAG: hypothetical protein COZ06_39160 [Armatimonadetes bacterium CG_4_10_14_3_um_filter_66_18]|nr:hypothetical protein [Armatimonadota bacterium]OIP11454.1 MAG: hypothetical protein AUJ96_02215 [Armatimonadetes bacterium CG2_30_66_41]PIU91693.1 MAG: hypothetical protein COS65_21220 [Armatimonadetes bacterium CG06_land_8_20_14_3_00_66_21]PIX47149.1 MAG: hypothetical protein COZ57_09295 [Armatimonadetes bacterium CG_4_8_14_3_um_filter_66_20]PIY34961.1 MAG: hypothetical protein COZ06_39160 [Armatimonadetes bacterium CG_4_10_14_3_um_filter_66_18]PIZ39891.1 MAG: hypothetical protein COY42_21
MPNNRATEVGQDRREFLRQSAQVAAASLFAGAALEDVIERVVHRVGESQAMQRLAGDAAAQLRGVQLQPRALAQQCCGS